MHATGRCDGWLREAACFVALREQAMREAGVRRPTGRAYSAALRRLLDQHPEALAIHRAHARRAALAWLHARADDARAWWHSLADADRARIATPEAAVRRMQQRPPPPKPPAAPSALRHLALLKPGALRAHALALALQDRATARALHAALGAALSAAPAR